MRLRAATPADEPFLHAVFASTRPRELALMPTPELAAAFTAQQYGFQQRSVASAFPDAEQSVVEDDAGTPVGRLILHDAGESLRVVELALLGEARGHGTGTALVRAVQERARRRGVPVVLHVQRDNPAWRLYERLGFAEEASDDLRLRMVWTPPGAQPNTAS